MRPSKDTSLIMLGQQPIHYTNTLGKSACDDFALNTKSGLCFISFVQYQLFMFAISLEFAFIGGNWTCAGKLCKC